LALSLGAVAAGVRNRRQGGADAPSSGELRLDLAQVSFDVVVQAKPGKPGWQFARKRFTPNTRHVRTRLARARAVRGRNFTAAGRNGTTENGHEDAKGRGWMSR
jgi:hypothetical protein